MMDFTKSTRKQLIQLCKDRGVKGYSGKKKSDLIALLDGAGKPIAMNEIVMNGTPLRQDILEGDCLTIMQTLADESAQIIIADPPYNIGKDFGNKSDKQPMGEYLVWCDKWTTECLRILKPNGTMIIYGNSKVMPYIHVRIPTHINSRSLIWHYTNKNVASLDFWQPSYENILLLWKEDRVFNRDDIREPYTEGFLKGAAGKQRKATPGRFSKGDKTTTYTAHPGGALPRDVIKIPALAGGAGAKERVDHPTQKPLALCEKMLKSCKQSAEQGYVLVPFAGSGSECVAAKNLGLPFVGIELNPTYVALCKERLAALDRPTESVKQTEQNVVE